MDKIVIYTHSDILTMNKAVVQHGDALAFYKKWATPVTIISDGAYGVNGFVGDPKKVSALPAWYRPHIEAWTKAATPQTSLWFWNTEAGWATMHPVLLEFGWKYIELITWDKGIQHIAGNVNSKTIRQFPVATEVSGLYVRPQLVSLSDSKTEMTLQDWLRSEWRRAGLTLSQANEACGVKNAASRKWLTGDAEWYAPTHEMFLRLKWFANENGKPSGFPYFESKDDISKESNWTTLRSRWNHQHGLTNVWQVPPLHGAERVKDSEGKYFHTNQKPLELMRRQIRATTDEGDVIWEPFGGLASASVAAQELNRVSYTAEMNDTFYKAALERVKSIQLNKSNASFKYEP
jgi:hypothetical protein